MCIWIILGSSILSLLWAGWNARWINSIKMGGSGESAPLIQPEVLHSLENISGKISAGANAFLFQEYSIMGIFIVLFAVLVFVFVDYLGAGELTFYATFAFVCGCLISILCGFIGMRVAVSANYRVTFRAIESLEKAYEAAFRGGLVMGFCTVGLGLLSLLGLLLAFEKMFQPIRLVAADRSLARLAERLAAFGLGASSMALFGRVGGGIYTKAADVGADLVGKVEEGLDEDSPRNPATIADNVGDNVGDIAGMGADLFGSFAEASCAALVISASTQDLANYRAAIFFPLLISAGGLMACLLASAVGAFGPRPRRTDTVGRALNTQLLLATLLSLPAIYLAVQALPERWMWRSVTHRSPGQGSRLRAGICASSGLLAGLFIGLATDFWTSHAYPPVRRMAAACASGPALNVIFGLALGYNSTVIPTLLLAVCALISVALLGMFGLALAALGMLATLAVGLAIDAYGPIADNAGGIAEMAGLPPDVRRRTDALDAAGNTTAAMGKGFAIGSAALVALSLIGCFYTQAMDPRRRWRLRSIALFDPWIIFSLLVGAMLPYAFSALTMKSVGEAAQDMVAEVRRQFRNPAIRAGTQEPDYERCIRVSTSASLRQMILPGLIVMLTPLALGILFHPALVAGLLPGALLSGVMLAVSMANTGGAWDNTKKYIESGAYINPEGVPKAKGSDEHKAAVVGDTVGDPLKDTSGPSLNILVKLMAILSVVFAEGFANTALLAGVFGIQTTD